MPALFLRLLLVFALAAAAALARAETAPAPAPAPAVRENAPVKVGNRVVFVVRGPIAGYGSAERAKASTERIAAILETDPAPAASQDDIENGIATRVLLGGKLAFVVTRADIEASSGETTQLVAREAGKRLEQAAAEWREQRTPRYLAEASALSAGATLLYGLLLWLLFRTNRWIGGRFATVAAARSGRLNVSGIRLLDRGRVLRFARRLFGLAAAVVALLLTSGWLSFVLERFPYTRPWGEELQGSVLGLLKEAALSVVQAVPGLLLVVVIFIVARTLARVIGVFFEQVEQGGVTVGWLDPDTVPPTRRIFLFVLWVFALGMAYPYLPGASTEAFKGLSVLVGVMVSLGGASVIGQAFNGLILMYTRAYRRGEYVRIGESEGTVMELGLFTTRVRTGMGEEITLPNSGVMGASVKNYSRAVAGTGYIVDTVVTIGYATPWRQVEAMLLEAAKRTAGIVPEPAPIVRQTSLSDYYVEYRLAAYTPAESPARRVDVLNRLHGNIQDVFNEHGVQIMSPHYMMDPPAPQVVPKKDWYAAPATPPGATEGGPR